MIDYKSMTGEELELYMYTLRKMAVHNVESDRTYMTDLYNLRAFHHKAAEIMLANKHLKFAMIVLDFANFKSINEFCGRRTGDELLKVTANALRDELKENVVLSHIRADIFGIITPFEDKQELIDMVWRIDGKIAAFQMNCRALLSFGICIADHAAMPPSVMRDYAMMALATIKGKFYAKYAFFDEKMHQDLMVNKEIENNIVEALEHEDLCIYIQPKVDMTSGEIIGGEALLRWNFHGEDRMISPVKFIPVIEKNGLIIDVDLYVWNKVFKFLGDRIAQGKKVVPISINISRVHVFDRSFKDKIVALSKEYNVPPEYVPLELTETGFLDNGEEIYADMDYLQSQGFSISMDDFGTGYSTMTMLKNQTVDEIKIDKGFIDDIENPKSQSIMTHTLDMLRELGMEVIVEGVENETQKEFLLGRGCKRAQGYLYYKPMPCPEFEALLDE